MGTNRCVKSLAVVLSLCLQVFCSVAAHARQILLADARKPLALVLASGVFTVPVKLALSHSGGGGGGGVGGGGVITTNRTISPRKPFVLTIPNPKQCNPKALRPHNPKPEASSSSPKQCNPKL